MMSVDADGASRCAPLRLGLARRIASTPASPVPVARRARAPKPHLLPTRRGPGAPSPPMRSRDRGGHRPLGEREPGDTAGGAGLVPIADGGMWTLSRPSATRRKRGTGSICPPSALGVLRGPAAASRHRPRPRAVQGGSSISAMSCVDTVLVDIARPTTNMYQPTTSLVPSGVEPPPSRAQYRTQLSRCVHQSRRSASPRLVLKSRWRAAASPSVSTPSPPISIPTCGRGAPETTWHSAHARTGARASV